MARPARPGAVAAPVHLIGLIPCLAFAVGTMVGGGVFTLSGIAIDKAGPAAIVSYLIAAAVMMLSALCFVAVSGRAAAGDSGYGPIGDLLGPVWRFLVMWAFYIHGTVIITFLLVSFGSYLNHYFVTMAGPITAGVVAAVALTALNLGPADQVAKAETWVVAAKITLLVFFIAWGMTRITHAHLTPLATHGSTGVISAAAGLFVGYTGFNVVTNIAGSVRNPARTIPLAVLGSILVAAVIYIGTVTAMLASGHTHFGTAGVGEAATALMGRWGGYLIAFTACLSTLSGANAQVLGASEVMLRLVAQGDVPPIAGRSTRGGRPFASVVFVGAIAVTLVLVANVGAIIIMANVAALVAMTIVNIAAVKLAWRHWPGSGLKLPLGVTVPVLATVACLAQLPFYGYRAVVIDLGVVATGLVLFAGRRWQRYGEHEREKAIKAIHRLETPLLRAARRLEYTLDDDSRKLLGLPHQQ